MELLSDPQIWLAFATLTALEIVLGIDNIIFISILVGRLPQEQRARGRTTPAQFEEDMGHIHVPGSQIPLLDGQGAFQQAFGTAMVTLIEIHTTHVAQRRGHLGVFWTIHTFLDGQCALIQGLGLAQFVLAAQTAR